MAGFLLPLPPPPPSFIVGLLAGAVLYLICRRLSPLLTDSLGTKSLHERVASLDRGKLFHYHSLFPSTIHALVQVLGTYHFVFWGREGYDNRHEGQSPAVTFDDRSIVPYGPTGLGPAVYMGIFAGYLLADFAAAPSLEEMGYPFVLHHIAAATSWTFCACNEVMQPVASLLQFNELSTPWMNVRQYLLTAGCRSSDLPVSITSLGFFFTFGLVRVAPLPFLVRDWVYRDFDAIGEKLGTGSAVFLSLFFAINGCLQCGWFFIMCQKLAGMINVAKIRKIKLQ
ncbi:hypothetical protein ACHAWF_015038 [Thalassiosira exigua]